MRELVRNNHQHIAILVDLQGLKIRIEHFKDGAIEQKKGVTFAWMSIDALPALLMKALSDLV